MVELTDKAGMNLRFAAGMIAAAVAELGKDAANFEIAPGLSLDILSSLMDAAAPESINPQTYGLVSIPAVLRLSIPVDATDADVKNLGAALVSAKKETVSSGVLDAALREHVSLTNPELSKMVLGSDLLVTTTNYHYVE